ncbi:hypothetical protein ACIP4Y_24365 [Streptomyces sp. NPDC088810]
MRTKDPQATGLASLAALIADETRAACLLALLDGLAQQYQQVGQGG